VTKNQAGAILMEVLLAVAIMTISLTVMIQALVSNMRSNVMARDYFKAEILLENVLFPLLQEQRLDPASLAETEFPPPDTRYHQKVEIKPLSLDAAPEGLVEVAAAVTWPGGASEKELQITTYLSRKGDNATK